MVIDHIHNNPQAVLMQRLDSLLHLPDAHCAVIGIGGIGAFRQVEIHGVIAPVVAALWMCFVNGAKVINGQQVNMGDPQLPEVVHAGLTAGRCLCSCFGEGGKFSFGCHAGGSIHGKVPHVQLIDNGIGEVLSSDGTLVQLPSGGIGGG